MKECNHCHRMNAAGALFCPLCGGNSFTPVGDELPFLDDYEEPDAETEEAIRRRRAGWDALRQWDDENEWDNDLF